MGNNLERVINLKEKIIELVTENQSINKIYLFGSRKYKTGSIRSDIDLLVDLDGEKIDFALFEKAREIEPYLDIFQLHSNSALNLGNKSQINGRKSASILKVINPELIWDRNSGWRGDSDLESIKAINNYEPIPSSIIDASTINPLVRNIDILIVTAIQEEFDEIHKRIEKYHPINTKDPYPTALIGSIPTKNKSTQDILVIKSPRIGNTSAALATQRSLFFWNPRCVVLIGISGGIEGKISLGDIVIPERIVEYEATKVTPEGNSLHGLILNTDDSLRLKVLNWSGLAEWLRKKSKLRRKLSEDNAPIVINTDAMASGHKVIASKEIAEGILEISRNITAIEMEAIGVAEACRSRIPFLVIKSISDYANKDKDDRYHNFCCELVSDLIINLIINNTI